MRDIISNQTQFGRRELRAPAPPIAGEPCPHPYLNEIANWPSVDEAFTLRSQEMLRNDGAQAWQQAGGQLTLSGRPTLQFFSPHTEEIVRPLVARHGGIRFTDVTEAEWCLRRVPSGLSGGTQWIGIGGGCLDCLLGTGCRRAAAAELGREFARRHEFRGASFEQWLPHHVRLLDLLHETRRYERVGRLLPVIMRHAKPRYSETIAISEYELARHYFRSDGLPFPANWAMELLGALKLLASIPVHTYEVPAGCSSPTRAISQQAMGHPQWTLGQVSLRLTPSFVNFFRPLLRKPSPRRGSRRSPRRVSHHKTGPTK